MFLTYKYVTLSKKSQFNKSSLLNWREFAWICLKLHWSAKLKTLDPSRLTGNSVTLKITAEIQCKPTRGFNGMNGRVTVKSRYKVFFFYLSACRKSWLSAVGSVVGENSRQRRWQHQRKVETQWKTLASISYIPPVWHPPTPMDPDIQDPIQPGGHPLHFRVCIKEQKIRDWIPRL